MPKKILNILLIMGVAIVLAVLIYIYGETIDNYSFEMAEIEENVSPKESDSNEVWTDFTESEEASQWYRIRRKQKNRLIFSHASG